MKTGILILTVLLFARSYAQNVQEKFAEIIEELAVNDIEVDIDEIVYLLEHPLDLNSASDEELNALWFLTEIELESIKSYRSQRKLHNLYELQSVPKLYLPSIQKLIDFTVIKEKDDVSLNLLQLLLKGDYKIYKRYAEDYPKGEMYANNDTLPSRYEGGPQQLYFRFHYRNGSKISYGLSAEKDAGEAFFSKSNKQGFDFHTFHFYLQLKSKIKVLAIGDYRLNIGQGLIAWSSFGGTKSTNTFQIKKTAPLLKPYTSINEVNFLRGAALTIAHKAWKATPFLSVKRIDATVDESSSNTRVSVQSSGLHRTESEINAQNNIALIQSGLVLGLQKRRFKIGINSLIHHFDRRLTKEKQLYNLYQFSDQTLFQGGLDYSVIGNNFLLFGESAFSKSAHQWGLASINGVIVSIGSETDLALLYRNYDKKYQSTSMSRSFGESTNTNNENGFFINLKHSFNRKLIWENFADFYRKPWLSFNLDFPSVGREYRSQLSYVRSKSFRLDISYRNESWLDVSSIALDPFNGLALSDDNRKPIEDYFDIKFEPNLNQQATEYVYPDSYLSLAEVEGAKIPTIHKKQSFRLNLKHKWSKDWEWRFRMQVNVFSDVINKSQSGTLVYQDVIWKPFGGNVKIGGRMALFNITGSSARVYSYENDVLYLFSVPSFNGKGARFYVNAHYKLRRWGEVWLRYAQTNSLNQQNLVEKTYEMKAQVRLSF